MQVRTPSVWTLVGEQNRPCKVVFLGEVPREIKEITKIESKKHWFLGPKMDPKWVQKSIIFFVIFLLHSERLNLTPEAQFLRDVSGEMQIFKTPIFVFWWKRILFGDDVTWLSYDEFTYKFVSRSSTLRQVGWTDGRTSTIKPKSARFHLWSKASYHERKNKSQGRVIG